MHICQHFFQSLKTFNRQFPVFPSAPDTSFVLLLQSNQIAYLKAAILVFGTERSFWQVFLCKCFNTVKYFSLLTVCHSGMNSWCTKLWISKKTLSLTLTFGRLWRGFFGFSSFLVLHSDNWLTCLHVKLVDPCLVTRYDLRNPACLKSPVHCTISKENSFLLDQIVRQRVSCPKYVPKSNEKTCKRCQGQALFLVS